MLSSTGRQVPGALAVCYEIWRGTSPDPGQGLWGAPYERCERGVCVEARTLVDAVAEIWAHYADPGKENALGYRELGAGDVIVANGEIFRIQREGTAPWPGFRDFLLHHNG